MVATVRPSGFFSQPGQVIKQTLSGGQEDALFWRLISASNRRPIPTIRVLKTSCPMGVYGRAFPCQTPKDSSTSIGSSFRPAGVDRAMSRARLNHVQAAFTQAHSCPAGLQNGPAPVGRCESGRRFVHPAGLAGQRLDWEVIVPPPGLPLDGKRLCAESFAQDFPRGFRPHNGQVLPCPERRAPRPKQAVASMTVRAAFAGQGIGGEQNSRNSLCTHLLDTTARATS